MVRNKSKQLKLWRSELDNLCERSDLSLEDVCAYAGFTYNGKETAMYKKLPKKRSVFIGTGMAFGLTLDEIDDWIMRYGGKKKLYAKDISEDLIWMYLIEANCSDRESGKNYYRLYEKCRDVAHATWKELWDELTMDPKDTADVEVELENVDYDDEFEGLKTFIMDHMDSFKVAYSKPRKMLDSYVDLIVGALKSGGADNIRGLTDLRGWLDDSMINYLSGDSEMINVIDRRSHRKTVRIKYVPKNKRIHIAMCLALGMGRSEMDRYLELMGFAPLGEGGEQEMILAAMLDEWEADTPGVTELKKILDGGECSLRPAGRLQAAEDMLMLRQELDERYKERGLVFPYMKLQKDRP